jgi:nitrogen fixation/metabolism regulation signal transduction histidine kinase
VVSQAQQQNEQYKTARTFATQKVSLEESVLSQVTTAVTCGTYLAGCGCERYIERR